MDIFVIHKLWTDKSKSRCTDAADLRCLQRIKTFLARYEQIYHHKLSQKEFLVRIIERELDEAEKDYERITTEQAAEENADVDSGEPDGTEMEVDAQY